MLVPKPQKEIDASEDYRYGFQGQEKDDEIKGEGKSLNYTFRMHDPRVGRFFATDPLEAKYPWYSPYQFSGNRVIDMVELEGLEPAKPPSAEGEKQDAVDQTAVATNDYYASDVIGWIFGSTENNKLYKSWVGHAVTGTNSYEWVEETNYKQMIMPFAIDYAQSEGWIFGTTWQSAQDKICNPSEANDMISGETMDFLSSRNLASDFKNYLTQIGAHEINSANKALYSSATGAITPMDLDSPFFGVGIGLRGYATGSKSVSGATFGAATSNNYRKTFFAAYPELEGQVIVHHAVEQQVLTRYNIVTEVEIHSLENLRGIPTELNSSLHLSDIRKEWNKFYRSNPNPTKQALLDKASAIDRQFGDQFLPKK
ncbi:RHS repeat-associated core domain-containing protein [Flavobacterium sp.]